MYLCKKLLVVTDDWGITNSIISITRDNASSNNVMLDEFEAIVAQRKDEMEEEEQALYSLKFNRKEGDVRCCAHVYNIAVQAGMFF